MQDRLDQKELEFGATQMNYILRTIEDSDILLTTTMNEKYKGGKRLIPVAGSSFESVNKTRVMITDLFLYYLAVAVVHLIYMTSRIIPFAT